MKNVINELPYAYNSEHFKNLQIINADLDK
jgi:hypothetical protein